jgi:hypothetical protein
MALAERSGGETPGRGARGRVGPRSAKKPRLLVVYATAVRMMARLTARGTSTPNADAGGDGCRARVFVDTSTHLRAAGHRQPR